MAAKPIRAVSLDVARQYNSAVYCKGRNKNITKTPTKSSK